MRHDPGIVKSFASDNWSGAHPRILDAIARAASGQAASYGEDPLSHEAEAAFRKLFNRPTLRSFLVFNGTAANVLGLRAVTRSFHSILCSRDSHLALNECGAPERLLGCKLVVLPHEGGKIRPREISRALTGFGDPHQSQPRVISISQPTEKGTVYTPAEIREIAELAHGKGLLLHMDGARIANAAAALGVAPAAFTCDSGVDVLSFGGTKCGLIFGEAVVFFDPAHARDFEFHRKQNLQLASKMRFIAAQFSELLESGLWLEIARHSNGLARRLGERASRIPGVELTEKVETNAVFASLPRSRVNALQGSFPFYVWDDRAAAPGDPEGRVEVRWMTSFDTKPDEIDAFVEAIAGTR